MSRRLLGPGTRKSLDERKLGAENLEASALSQSKTLVRVHQTGL